MKRTRVQNPVLTGFHPDPSLIRVGEDYYIANSSFEWYPGVTISHSKDLVNWTTVARPLDRLSLLDMKGNPKSGGIWAPCLSYYKGLFYLIYTDVKSWYDEPFKDTHNYLVTAPAIEGPWSEPLYMNSSGFDASLFHDEDGRKWYLNMEWDYRKATGSPQFTGILIQEFDPHLGQLVGPVTKIFEGTDRGLVEGPHLYKKDGYYYLMTAEGGTSYDHAITICRSKNLLGPYDLHPDKHLVTSKGTDAYIQKSGHGSWCDTPDGKWYVSFLCGRPLPGTKNCTLGRETSIQEMVWKNDWPYLVHGNSTPQSTFEVDGEIEPLGKKTIEYDFNSHAFKMDFQTLRIPYAESMFEVIDNNLVITGHESPVSKHQQALLARRQDVFSFDVETRLSFDPDYYQHMAGLSYRYDETNQYYCYVTYDEALASRVIQIIGFNQGKHFFLLDTPYKLPEGDVTLKLSVKENWAQFYTLDKTGNPIALGDAFKPDHLSDDYTDPMGFTGAFVGMMCTDMSNKQKKATFKSFLYSPKV